jgi:serine/threonine-protein kinase
MIASVVAHGGGVVSLDPEGLSAVVSLRRGNATVAEVVTSGDVAAAAVGRLARMAGLDALVELSSLVVPRAARFPVRLGKERADVLVTIGATPAGMHAEVRLMSIRGRPVESRSPAQLKRCVACGTFQPPMRVRCDLDGAALQEVWDEPSPGGTIGAYLVGAPLGEGAMGEVFAAEHALLERRVAIKILHADRATDPLFESRFLLEARAASRLHHPNVVEVTDYGVLASGSPYLVMERLEGESLERRLAREPALDPRLALRIARAVAEGLGAAHARGVIHNDLKPSNVFMVQGSTDDAPRVKVIDFGAASLAGRLDDGMIVGTAGFMAPERITGDGCDARSDVYSLGVVLFRMIAGSLPFEGKDSRTLFAAQKGAPRELRSPKGALSSRTVRLVMRALEKRPGERHQTMEQLIVEIDHALRALEAPAWRRWLP